MFIRTATANDIDELKALYYNTITTVNTKDYNTEQIKAWSSTAGRTERLIKKINEQHFYIVETTDKIITGFASLSTLGYLDMMYVHKDFQGKGIAKLLLEKILETAEILNLSIIESDVSITAKPFFEKQGFKVLKEQTVKIEGVVLTNFKMQLIIGKVVDYL